MALQKPTFDCDKFNKVNEIIQLKILENENNPPNLAFWINVKERYKNEFCCGLIPFLEPDKVSVKKRKIENLNDAIAFLDEDPKTMNELKKMVYDPVIAPSHNKFWDDIGKEHKEHWSDVLLELNRIERGEKEEMKIKRSEEEQEDKIRREQEELERRERERVKKEEEEKVKREQEEQIRKEQEEQIRRDEEDKVRREQEEEDKVKREKERKDEEDKVTNNDFKTIIECKQFSEAISKGDLTTVEKLEHHIKNNKNVLFVAIYYKHWNIVSFLIEYGVDIHQVDKLGNTALFYVAHKGKLDVIKQLIDKDINLNHVNSSGYTPIHCAGNADTARFLIENDADINHVNENDNTPLYSASWYGRLDVVELLLNEYKLNPNHENKNKCLPFHFAFVRKHLDVAKYLLDNGTDIEKVLSVDMPPEIREKMRSFIEEWKKEQEEQKKLSDDNMEIIKEKEEFANSADKEVIVISDNKEEQNPIILEKNKEAKENSIIIEEFTPIDDNKEEMKRKEEINKLYKAVKGNDEIVVEKLAHRINDNPFLLIDASKKGDLNMVRLLLDSGVNVNHIQNGYTALHYATDNKHFEVIKLLVDGGANLDQESGYNRFLPFHYAFFKNRLDIAKYLLDQGTDIDKILFADISPQKRGEIKAFITKSRETQQKQINSDDEETQSDDDCILQEDADDYILMQTSSKQKRFDELYGKGTLTLLSSRSYKCHLCNKTLKSATPGNIKYHCTGATHLRIMELWKSK